MKKVKQSPNANRMRCYLTHLGSNQKDNKTKAADEKLKEPPYYLKKKEQDTDKQ